MKRLLRHEIGVVIGGQVTQLAIGVLTSTLIARALHADGYGLVNLVRVVFQTAATIAPLGLDASLLKFCGMAEKNDPVVAAVVARLRLAAVGVSALVAAGVGLAAAFGLLSRVYPYNGVDTLFFVAFIALPFATDSAALNAVYRARGRAGRYALFGPYLQSALRIILVPLAAWLSPDVLTFVWINALQIVVTQLALTVDLHRWSCLETPADASQRELARAAARRVMGESFWMCLSIFTYSLMRGADMIFLGASADAADIGAYAALAMVAQLIPIFPMAASQSLGPAISQAHHRGDTAGVKRLLDDYLCKGAPVAAYFFAGIALFGQRLDLIFGSSFHFSAAVCFLLPLGQVLSATLSPMGFSLSMTGRHREENAILVLGGVLLLVLCATFVPHYGSVAAAGAVAVTFLVVDLARFALVSRVIGEVPGRLRDFLPAPVGLLLAYVAQGLGDAIGGRDLATTFFSCVLYTLFFAAFIYRFSLSAEQRAALAPLLLQSKGVR